MHKNKTFVLLTWVLCLALAPWESGARLLAGDSLGLAVLGKWSQLSCLLPWRILASSNPLQKKLMGGRGKKGHREGCLDYFSGELETVKRSITSSGSEAIKTERLLKVSVTKPTWQVWRLSAQVSISISPACLHWTLTSLLDSWGVTYF